MHHATGGTGQWLLINIPIRKKLLVEGKIIHSRVTSYGASKEVGYVDHCHEPAELDQGCDCVPSSSSCLNEAETIRL